MVGCLCAADRVCPISLLLCFMRGPVSGMAQVRMSCLLLEGVIERIRLYWGN